jgi:hypothetical protein
MTTQNAYAEVGEKLARLDALEVRLTQIEPAARALEGPLPKAEVVAALVKKLREKRSGLLANGRNLAGRLADGRTLRVQAAPDSGGAALDVFLLLQTDAELEGRARALVASLDYVEGIPTADRYDARCKLADERESIVVEHESIVEELNSLGVSAREHLAETVARRATDAAARDRDADLARRQEEAAKRLDEQPRRPVPCGSDGEDFPVLR